MPRLPDRFPRPSSPPTVVSVPELGRLTTRTGSLDPMAVHMPQDFPMAALLKLRATDLFDPKGPPVRPFSYVDDRTIKVNAFCGAVEVGDYQVEILPKSWRTTHDAQRGRQALALMVDSFLEQTGSSRHASAKNDDATMLSVRRGPLTERIMEAFVDSAEGLLELGVRFGYKQVREQQKFLRGRLDVARQLRQRPGKAHVFHLRHTLFQADRPENRLIRSGAEHVARRSQNPRLRLRAREVLEQFWVVPPSRDVEADLARWDRGRLLAHYRDVERTTRLLLRPAIGHHAGASYGDAWLWQSDRLFEKHLARHVRSRLMDAARGMQLVVQTSSLSLGLANDGRRHFTLKPDLAVKDGGRFVGILDTKWRLVDPEPPGRRPTVGISSNEVYQMYAYGMNYLGGSGPLVLIYPAWERFSAPSGPITLNGPLGEGSAALTVIAVPFDLNAGAFLLDGLAVGALGPLEPVLRTTPRARTAQ